MSATETKPEQGLEKPKPKGTPAVITTPDEYKESIQRWNAANFHILTPAVNFSGLPPQHGMVAALVQINPDPASGDVYQDKLFCEENEVAIAKLGLSKIAQAAGMTIRTTRQDARDIQYVWEVKATVRYLGLDGTPQELEATVEYDLRDSSPRVQKLVKAAQRKNRDATAQIEGARMYGLRGAEARAINAAIRLFGIKQKYTKAELSKPFVTLRVMFQPDMSDPRTRELVTERALQGTTALYAPQSAALPSAPIEQVIDVIGAPAGETQAASTPVQKTAPPEPPDTPPTASAVRVVKIEETLGQKSTLYTIHDSKGRTHKTRNKNMADTARKAEQAKHWVEIDSEDGELLEIVLLATPATTTASPQGTLPGIDNL